MLTMTEQGLLTPEDVAKRLKVKVSTVITYLRTGQLKGVKLGGRIWRIDPADLREFIESQKRHES